MRLKTVILPKIIQEIAITPDLTVNAESKGAHTIGTRPCLIVFLR